MPDWGWLPGHSGPTLAAAEQQYDFRWRLSGDRAVAPLQVFDDGRQTWLQFAPQQALPAIFRSGRQGDLPLDYRRVGPYVVLDGVWPRLVLRGGALRSVVERTDGGASTAASARAAAGGPAATLALAGSGTGFSATPAPTGSGTGFSATPVPTGSGTGSSATSAATGSRGGAAAALAPAASRTEPAVAPPAADSGRPGASMVRRGAAAATTGSVVAVPAAMATTAGAPVLAATASAKPKLAALAGASSAIVDSTHAKPLSKPLPKPLPGPAARPAPVALASPIAPSYEVGPRDGNLRLALSRWARAAGWTFEAEHWAVDADIPITGSARFDSGFKRSVQDLVAATELSEKPLQPCFYSNKVLRIVPYAQACDRSADPARVS